MHFCMGMFAPSKDQAPTSLFPRGLVGSSRGLAPLCRGACLQRLLLFSSSCAHHTHVGKAHSAGWYRSPPLPPPAAQPLPPAAAGSQRNCAASDAATPPPRGSHCEPLNTLGRGATQAHTALGRSRPLSAGPSGPRTAWQAAPLLARRHGKLAPLKFPITHSPSDAPRRACAPWSPAGCVPPLPRCRPLPIRPARRVTPS